jgi:DNA mismatch endonuclease (patch repair protein)
MMSRVRSRGSKAELLLRSMLWRAGYRFRLSPRNLIGKPDLVFSGPQVAVFIDGDFWHGRALREGGESGLRQIVRGERFPWWRDKLNRNVSRDDEVTKSLRRDGWRVIRVWESEVLSNPDGVALRIGRILNRSKRQSSVAKRKRMAKIG